MDITIRRATPHEYATLGEITAQAYLGDGLLDFGENDDYLDELHDVAKRAAAAEVLVAVTDGRVLGGVTFVPAGGLMADIARAGEAEIRMLAVAPEARGRGRRRGTRTSLPGAGSGRGGLCTPRAVDPAGHAHRPSHLRTARFHPHTRARLEPLPDLPDLTLITYELTL